MLVAFLGICLGVIIAVVLPVLRGFVSKTFQATAAPGLPPWVKRYGGLTLFAVATGTIVLAAWNQANPNTTLSFWAAVVLGFGWESFLEKAVVKPHP